MEEKVKDVREILEADGIADNDFNFENLERVNIDQIINSKDSNKAWSYRIINTSNNSATLISQLPGEGSRSHYHSNWHEWWLIIRGYWRVKIENKDPIHVKQGDIVFLRKNIAHKITCIGSAPAIRLAVSRQDVEHTYL